MSKIPIGHPDTRLIRGIETIDRRVRQLEGTKTLIYRGPRTDDPDGNGSNVGERCVIGDQGDGTFGLRVWADDGTLAVDDTA